MFIYEIKNLVNNKRYIGQTTYENPNNRWSAHKSDLKKKKSCNIYLQRAWNKNKEINFEFNILDTAKNQKELDKLEKFYIQKFNTLNSKFGYNLRSGGARGKHSDETKEKLSLSRIGVEPWNKGRKLGPQSLKMRIKKSKKLRKYCKEYPLIEDVSGNIFKIETIKGFCREHNIRYDGNFRRMINGKIIHYAGWHIKGKISLDTISNKLKLNFYNGFPDIKSPTGKIYNISNLTKFCKKHNLTISKISEVLNKKRRSHKGWTLN